MARIPSKPIVDIVKEKIKIPGVRISKEAKEILREKVIMFLENLAEEIEKNMKILKRKTVKKEDIERAYKRILCEEKD